MQKSATIYVAGATTLAGAALVRQLHRQGYCQVIGDEADAPDVRDRRDVETFFRRFRPAYVFHAAGLSGGIRANQESPADLCADNLAAALHVIEAAHRHGVERLLYLASSCCYPKHAAQPMTTDVLWAGGLEPTSRAYAAAKLAGIALCQAYRDQHGHDFRVGIPATVFGPGDHFDEGGGHVIPSLMARLHAAREQGLAEVAVWGTGAPRREFIFADDLAAACIVALQRSDAPALLNLGSGQTVSIAELAKLIAEVVQYPGRIVFDAGRPDGALRKELCSAPLRALGWRPATTLREGLVAAYRSYLESASGEAPVALDRPERSASSLKVNVRRTLSTAAELDATFYRELLRIRRVEEAIARVYPSDKIVSPVHLSIGQEAVAVGVCQALGPRDVVFGSYRSHAYYLAKGGDLPGMIAELYGKATGVAQGKAGSMHLIDASAGVMGASAIVASTIPQAVGYAWALKLRGERRVVVVFFGEGATEEGVFYESLNFAALKNLPILFVCENNGYAIHSRQGDRQAASDVCRRARAQGLAAEHFAEMDIYRLFAQSCQAVEALRGGESPPMLFECRCYRWREHVGPGEDFDAGYRSAHEAAPWLAADPLPLVAQRLPEGQRLAIEREVEDEIDAAFDFAERSPLPDPGELHTDLFA